MTDKRKKLLLPLLILAVSAAVTFLVVRSRSPVERVEVEAPPPLVRVEPVQLVEERLTVDSRGEVRPATEATLVTEVPGKVVWTSSDFHDGGFFRKGASLVRLDRRDYELAVTRAEAEEARSNVRLMQAQAEAEIAVEEWSDLGEGEAPPLVRRVPQVKEAQAGVLAARAALQEARLNLARTEIRAPYTGRIRNKLTDVGQFLGPGQPVAAVYGTGSVEIRLPVLDRDLAHLDLPLATAVEEGPEVVLSAPFAGELRRWRGRVVRTEGQIDPSTRMVGLVARVEDPYEDPVPLTVGLFVDAEILGSTARVVRLPRAALYEGDAEGDRVMVVEEGERLRFRPVEVLQREGGEVLIGDGLAEGELVCLSPLEAPVDGMEVRTTLEGDDP